LSDRALLKALYLSSPIEADDIYLAPPQVLPSDALNLSVLLYTQAVIGAEIGLQLHKGGIYYTFYALRYRRFLRLWAAYDKRASKDC
jgi:hypothetical protein